MYIQKILEFERIFFSRLISHYFYTKIVRICEKLMNLLFENQNIKDTEDYFKFCFNLFYLNYY